jgi:2-phospho-L-lactate guanylyltransferase
MSWTAIVPLKTSGARKSRLADLLSSDERTALSLRMFRHVIDVLDHHPQIDPVIVLSDAPPPGWDGDWAVDDGRGLNIELAALRATITTDFVVLHADLPLLEINDIDALLSGAEQHAIAIAPDRHGTGTNGLAIKSGVDLDFHFGLDSFRLHRDQAPTCAVVMRGGFAIDLDTPDDFAVVRAAGWS